MNLAPELCGAFLFGEGVHGDTRPDGHFMDDLLESWSCEIDAGHFSGFGARYPSRAATPGPDHRRRPCLFRRGAVCFRPLQ
jgi:hypothetical protein